MGGMFVIATRWLKYFETKFEYIRPVWNMYLGGFDPETSSSSDSSCPTLNQHGYIPRLSSEVMCPQPGGT